MRVPRGVINANKAMMKIANFVEARALIETSPNDNDSTHLCDKIAEEIARTSERLEKKSIPESIEAGTITSLERPRPTLRIKSALTIQRARGLALTSTRYYENARAS